MKTTSCILFLVCIICCYGYGQSYHAVNGSPFGGSTAIRNNPAAAVGSVYKWDVNILSFQVKQATNALMLDHFSLGNYDSADVTIKSGFSNRRLHNNLDLGLFGFHYKFNDKQAIAVGLRARTYNHVKTSAFAWSDSINGYNEFFKQNRNTASLSGFVTHAGWIEGDLNYSQVLHESSSGRLTGGITLQIMRSISGAFAKANKFSFTELKNGTDTSYVLVAGGGAVGYSANYDQTATGNPSTKEFLKNTKTGFGLSLGVEYTIYDLNSYNEVNEDNLPGYSWKFGASLMDIGANKFVSSIYSAQFGNFNTNITDTSLARKFNGVNDIEGLHDTLATVFTTFEPYASQFSISMPTRLVLNVDKRISKNVYINGDLSLNFYSSADAKKLRTRELNLLTITPRWETIAWGAYLPIQYNTEGQLWIGAAVKIGPLVAGIHNFGIFKKNPQLNGGGYLMLNIHPFSRRKVISRLDCPVR